MPSQNKYKILVGCDPEIFLRNPTTKKFISAHTLIPGNKNEPFPVDGGAIQVDGVAAEYNINPANSLSQWLENNNRVIDQIRNRAQNYELVYEPTAVFDKNYFKKLPDEVRELGCNPDFNAWTGGLNVKPDGDSTTMRTGAGHVHIGWTKDADTSDEAHINDCHIVVRNADYYLGLPSMFWDPDNKRRSLYGKAGAHRRKSYGVEYRTLSNKWVGSPILQEYVYNTTIKCMYDVFEGCDLEEEYKNSAQIIIDNNIRWWDYKELCKYRDQLPPKIDLKRLSSFYKFIKLPLPNVPPPEAPAEKRVNKAKHFYSRTNVVS